MLLCPKKVGQGLSGEVGQGGEKICSSSSCTLEGRLGILLRSVDGGIFGFRP